MDLILQKVKENLEKLNIKNCSILLAFSGGKDSSTLLSLLYKLSSEYNLKLGLAYVNHNLRDDSKNEDFFVKTIAQQYDLKIYIKTVKKDFWFSLKKESVEMAARKIRYDFFYSILKKEKYDFIATAHNFNDNIETFFLKILRGSDIDAIKGIPLKNRHIIRPMLLITREEIDNYIKINNIKYYEDSTNKENIYRRNIVRNELIPILNKINKDFLFAFFHTFKNLEEISSFFKKITLRFLKQTLVYKTKSLFLFDKNKFQKLSPFLKKRVIKAALNRIELLDILSFSFLEKISTNKIPRAYKKKSFLYNEKGKYLWLVNTQYYQQSSCSFLIKKLPEIIHYKNQKLFFDFYSDKYAELNFKKNFCFCFKNGVLPIVIRSLQQEDCIYLKNNKRKNIFEILKEFGIPKIVQNDTAVITTNDGEIIGFIIDIFFRVSHNFFIDENSKKIVIVNSKHV